MCPVVDTACNLKHLDVSVTCKLHCRATLATFVCMTLLMKVLKYILEWIVT